jgi:hypothetical protein
MFLELCLRRKKTRVESSLKQASVDYTSIHTSSFTFVPSEASIRGRILVSAHHSWASASKKLTPASAFRHPQFQFGTGPKMEDCSQLSTVPIRFRHRKFFFSLRYRTDRMPDGIPAFVSTHIYICFYMHMYIYVYT